MTARILHVTPYMDAAAGGPSVVVDRLAEHAAENGYDAQILTSAALTDDGGTALRHSYPGATILHMQKDALLGDGRQQVAAAVKEADILHLHTMWSPLVAAAARAARGAGVPYVMSPHGMLDPWSLGQKALKKRLYWQMIERGVATRAARMVYTSTAERDLAAESVAPTATPAVIPLGGDIPPAPRETLARAFFAENPDLAGHPLVIFLGRLHPKKRPEALVAAVPAILRAVPGARLLLVGPAEADTRAALTAQVQDLGLQEAVRLTGPRTGDAKWQALAAADLFVLPSQQENFAIAVAEALQVGLPVLLTRKVNIWQEVTEAGAGRVLEEDDLPGSIATQVAALLLDDAARTEASGQATDLAARAFTWQRCAQKTCAMYDEILAR